MGQKLKFAVLAIAVFVNAVYLASAANINADGGYDVTIAIDEGVAKTSPTTKQYLENIKISLQKLSASMYIATNKFWIKSAKILVPKSWDLGEEDDGNTVYQHADIKITNEADVPMVQNPNLCRLPGDFMELPGSFFDVANYNDYGEIHKALLHQWARLRWGVWEEHGYPGDARFPYAWQKNGVWTVTGCSEVPIEGEWKHFSDATVVCNPNAAQLDVGCRFFPFYNNTAKSSIMSYHNTWSVTKFCDAASKDIDAPHRQNLLCDRQSSLETIESSADFAKVTTGTEPKVINIQVVRPMKLAPLHIVVDRGQVNVYNVDAITELYNYLHNYFSTAGDRFMPDQQIALSVFGENGNAGLRQVFGPGLWSDQRRDQIMALFENITLGEAEHRDFTLAVQDAANAVSDVNPAVGSFVLIIKTGSVADGATLTSLKATELALLSKKTQLYAIELGQQHLKKVAETTLGQSVVLDSVSHNINPVFSLMSLLSVRLRYPNPIGMGDLRESVSGEKVSPNAVKTIPLAKGSDNVYFHFTYPQELNVKKVIAGVFSNGINYPVAFTQSREFGSAGAYVYEGHLDISKMDVTEVSFSFSPETTTTVEGTLYVSSDGKDIARPIELHVATTNDGNNEVDLANPANPYQPFAIHARLTQGQSPVKGARITCDFTIWNSAGSGLKETLTLLDDGDGQADVAAEDGVYSIVHVPKQDGAVTITCTANKAGIPPKPDPVALSVPRLLPIDQNFTASPAVDHPAGLTVAGQLVNQIQIKNRASYKSVVLPIRNLELTVAPKSNNLTFTFTESKVLGEDRLADGYRVFLAQDKNNFINFNPDQKPTEVDEANVTSSIAAPQLTATYETTLAVNTTFHVIVVAYAQTSDGSSRIHSDISNIESFVHQGETTDPDADEGKPWIKTTAGIITVVAIVVVVLGTAVGGFFYMKKKRSASTGSRA